MYFLSRFSPKIRSSWALETISRQNFKMKNKTTIGGGREEGTRASAGPLRSPFLPRAVRVDQPSGRHLASGGRARPVDQPAGRHLEILGSFIK